MGTALAGQIPANLSMKPASAAAPASFTLSYWLLDSVCGTAAKFHLWYCQFSTPARRVLKPWFLRLSWFAIEAVASLQSNKAAKRGRLR